MTEKQPLGRVWPPENCMLSHRATVLQLCIEEVQRHSYTEETFFKRSYKSNQSSGNSEQPSCCCNQVQPQQCSAKRQHLIKMHLGSINHQSFNLHPFKNKHPFFAIAKQTYVLIPSTTTTTTK